MVSKLQLTVTLFVGLLACSNSLSPLSDDNRSGTMEKRQGSPVTSCEDFPNDSNEYLQDRSDCVNIPAIYTTIRTLVYDYARNNKANRALLENTLDDFCNSVCYDDVVLYYTNCSKDALDFYQNVVCGRDGGTYCAIAGLEELANGDINPLEIDLQCTTDGDVCPRQECIDILEGISQSLGCCAGSLFNNSLNDYPYTLSEDYEKCNLILPAVCSGYAFLPAKTIVAALVFLALLIFAF